MKIETFLKDLNFDNDKYKELTEKFHDMLAYKLDDIALYLNDESLRDETGNNIDRIDLDAIRKEISNYSTNQDNILLSEIIKYLKEAGFEIINIIDKSCRAYERLITKDEIEKINRDELMASEFIDKTQGGKTQGGKKKRKSRKKSHKKSHKKSRISK